MKITSILSKDCVLDNLNSRHKRDVIVEMVNVMKSLNKIKKCDFIVENIMKREILGSTGIGYGVAIPHTKVDGLDTLLAMFGRSTEGIDFDSLDGLPVRLFFLLLTPKNSNGQHLRALTRIASLLKDHLLRQELLESKNATDIYSIIEREDKICT